MRWTAFTIAAYVLLSLDAGLARHIAFETETEPAAPSFVLVLAVFVALFAPARTALLACGILGLLADLAASPYLLAGEGPTRSVTLIGPHALGFVAGGYLVLLLRSILIRRHPMALAVMCILAGAEAQLVVVAILWVRQWYEPLAGFNAVEQLIPRGLGLLYTGVVALFLAIPLSWSASAFAFPATQRSPARSIRPHR